MAQPILRDWVRGDSFSASHLNEPLPIVRSVRTIVGDGKVEVFQGDQGTAISLPDDGKFLDHFLAVVTNTGPNQEADYTDARYWVQAANIQGANSYDKIQTLPITAPDDPMIDYPGQYPGSTRKAYPDTFTATNLPEWPIGSHSLKTDKSQLVHVWGFFDNQDTQVKRYVFAFLPIIGRMERVNLTQTGGSNGNATTACSYTYTATDLNGNQLGTSLSPEKPREAGTMTAATMGTGYYNTSGTFVLYEAAEYATTTKCA